jgi:hypothetical protein
MKLFKWLVTIAIVITAIPASAQGNDPSDFKPSFSASQSMTSTARVEAINLDDNTFRLRESDGEVRQHVDKQPHE